MHRARASVPPEAIRIEDEVWQEAFSERPRNRRRLRSLEGGRSADRARVAGRPAARPLARRISGPVAPRPAVAPGGSGSVTARTEERPFDDVELRTAPAAAAGPPARRTAPAAAAGPPARRTVTITGRGAERNLWPTDASRRRAAKRVHERAGFRPDRFAMWALLLGLLLVLVAAFSAHA